MPDNTRTKLSSLPRLLKWTLGLIAGLLILIVALQLTFNILLQGYLQNKLKEIVHRSTREIYELDFDEMHVSVLEGVITIQNLSLQPDTANLDNTRQWSKVPLKGNLKAERFSIQSIGIWDLLIYRRLHITSVSFQNPELLLERIKIYSKEDTTGANQDSSGQYQNLNRLFYRATSPYLKSVSIDKLEFIDASLNLKAVNKKHEIAGAENLNLSLQNITVDSVSARNKYLFPSHDIEMDARQVFWNAPGNFYKLTAGTLGVSSSDQTAFVDSLLLIPMYPKYEFSRKMGHEVDRIDLLIERIKLSALNVKKLVHERRFSARKLAIEKPEIEIFHNKKVPSGLKRPSTLPNIMFRNFSFPITIDTISATGGFISYAEHYPLVTDPGTITFEELEADFTKVSNDPNVLNDDYETKIEAQAKIMGEGLMKTEITMPINDVLGTHTIKGTMGAMSVADLNPMLQNAAFVRAESGVIHSAEFSFTLNRHISEGSIIVDYEDLNIKVLNREHPAESREKVIKTFLANTFAIKKSNTTIPLRQGTIYFERTEGNPLFNYWWKSLLSGLKDCIGL